MKIIHKFVSIVLVLSFFITPLSYSSAQVLGQEIQANNESISVETPVENNNIDENGYEDIWKDDNLLTI